MRYPRSHLLLSWAIGLAVLALTGGVTGPVWGAAFYAGREVYQWKWLGRAWDMPGFVWGVVPTAALEGLLWGLQ